MISINLRDSHLASRVPFVNLGRRLHLSTFMMLYESKLSSHKLPSSTDSSLPVNMTENHSTRPLRLLVVVDIPAWQVS